MWHGLRLLEGELADGARGGHSHSGRDHDLHRRHRSARRSIVWSATSAPRSRCSTTPSALACTPRRGSSAATPVSTPPTSVPPTSPTSAMFEGVEWNVRLAKAATPSLMDKFRATFDAYWNSPEFESYDPDRDRDRLDDALLEAGASRAPIASPSAWSGSKSVPTPTSRRCSTRSRSSGSSTTGIATWSSPRRAPARPSSPPWTTDTWSRRPAAGRPTLLFVAHRREILEQSMRTYREVLADA